MSLHSEHTTPEEALSAANEAVKRGGSLSPDQLTALSHLDAAAVSSLERNWRALNSFKQTHLLGELQAAEANDARLDFNAMYGLALHDAEPIVRRTAIEAIVEDVGAVLLGDLLRLAANDPDSSVRAAASKALAPFALGAELGELAPDQTVALTQTLQAILQRADEALAVRQEALAALGYIGDTRVDEEIRRALKSPELRLSAIRAIGRTADASWRGVLAKLSADADPRVREEVARACGEMADQRFVTMATDLVEDPSLDVRTAAIAALGQIGGEEARDALIYALEDKRAVIRDAATEALSQIAVEDDPLAL